MIRTRLARKPYSACSESDRGPIIARLQPRTTSGPETGRWLTEPDHLSGGQHHSASLVCSLRGGRHHSISRVWGDQYHWGQGHNTQQGPGRTPGRRSNGFVKGEV